MKGSSAKIDLINEQDLIDIQMGNFKKEINRLKDKDDFVASLPYAEDQIRIPCLKTNNCNAVMSRFFVSGVLFGLLLTPTYTHYKRSLRTSPYITAKLLPFYLLRCGFAFSLLGFLQPGCQITSRNDQEPLMLEEQVIRTLIENCDIYDYLDAIMDLKYKYSDYEMNQLIDEMRRVRYDNSLENLKYFSQVTAKKKI